MTLHHMVINAYAYSVTDFGALVYPSGNQAVSSSLSERTFDTEVYDLSGWHDTVTNNGRLTIISGVSLIRLTSNMAADGDFRAAHQKAGANFRGMGHIDTFNTGNRFLNLASAPIAVSAAEYFQTFVVNDVTANTTLADNATWAAIEKLPAALKYSLVYRSAGQSIAAGTNTILAWDSEVADTDAFHGSSATVTITIASPGVVTWTGHNFANGTPIVLTTAGALPTGLTAGTIYYVVSSASNTFQLAATPGGTAINTSGSQSGVHTGTNTSRLTVPSGVTLVRLCANASGGSVTGQLFLGILKNGATARGLPFKDNDTSGAENLNIVSAPIEVATGDYFEVQSFATSATTIGNAEDNWFSIEEVPSTYKRALVNKSAGQTLSAAVSTVLTWGAEVYDTDSIHDNSSNNSRLTVPSGVTRARPSFSVRTGSTANQMVGNTTKNGSDYQGQAKFDTDTAGTDSVSAIGAWIDVVAGDYFECVFFSQAGTTITTDNETWFCLECQ